MTTVTVSLTQVVITLRFVFFGMGGFVLITTEWNRIYAVTKKNRMIASCFFVITISQFALGLYQVAYTATRGGESVTGCRPWFLPIMFQRNPSHRSHFRFTWYAFSCNIGPCKLGWPPYLSCLVRNLSCPWSRRHPPWSSIINHPPDFLAFSIIVYRVVQSNTDRIPIPRLFKIIVQDATYYFLVIFTSHLVLMMFLFRKCKDIVIMFYHLRLT